MLLLLPACAGSALPEPTAAIAPSSMPVPATAVPTETQTPLPTSTPLPTETSTPVPTRTFTPSPTPPAATETTSGFHLPLPTGTPLDEWQGIPIHPDALAGEETQGSYVFTAALSVADIETYYKLEMPRRGWGLLATGQGGTGAILLIFQKESQMATISVLVVDSDTVYVMIVL